MFEEVSIWSSDGVRHAIRYSGFRNLKDGSVWIAFANHLALNDDRDLRSDEMIAAQSVLESFLSEIPNEKELWKPTIIEAVESYIARETAEMERLAQLE